MLTEISAYVHLHVSEMKDSNNISHRKEEYYKILVLSEEAYNFIVNLDYF